MKTGGRRFLGSKERKVFLTQFFSAFKIDLAEVFGDKQLIEQMVLQKNTEVYFINSAPVLIKIDEGFVPALVSDVVLNRLPRVVVDMGAIPKICNGADVMAPGIVSIQGSFNSGLIIAITDEKHGKFIAVGKALVDSDELKSTKSGKAVKNLHYIGDDLWRLIKNLH
jgi:PUA domain protein